MPIQRTDTQGIYLSGFVEEFLKIAAADRRPGTMKIYKAALNKFVEMTGNILLNEITARHFDQYKSMRVAVVSPITVNIDLRALRAAFRTGVRWKYLPSDCFEGSKLIPIPQTERAYISQDIFPKFLLSIKEQWLRDVILFNVLSGVRREELIKLKISNYNSVTKDIIIKSSENFKTKTGKIRVIPLKPTAQYIVESHIAMNKSEYLFFLENGQPMSGDYLTHRFKQCARSFGLSEDINLKANRHAFASWLVQNGSNLFAVQRLLGHGSITTTQIYSHLSVKDLRSAVDNLPDFKDLLGGNEIVTENGVQYAKTDR